MPQDPLDQPCTHVATPEELQRDPTYLLCNATPGAPCAWARRFDGCLNPHFHSERLEAAPPLSQFETATQKQAFREAVLETGLI